MSEFHFAEILLPEGWARNVAITVDANGLIASISPDTPHGPEAVRLGVALPGMANVHSHAFQRGMAGLSERRGPGEDSFWSWRQIMYAFNDNLTPDHVEAIAALVYCEMLETGFTSVGEFHYLHHDESGHPYNDIGEMAGRICAAAGATGIALTLLPVLYRHSNFGDMPPSPGQRRFINTLDNFADLVVSAKRHMDTIDHAVLGLAPHSLRAASASEITSILPLSEGGPIHIHAAEQQKEVDDCLAATGQRPVQYLFGTQDVDQRWCLIHATHMSEAETAMLAASGAVAGLCPLTEGNLGDGFFNASTYLAAGGRIGIGSDSHIRIDLAEDLRLLEYGQRLQAQRRNVLAPPGGSTGRRLFDAALAGSNQALQQPSGRIETGRRADFVILDDQHPTLVGRAEDARLDSWLFCGDSRLVREVYVGGQCVVHEGRALTRDRIEAAYRTAMLDIRAAIDR
ncbi:formimidoylglutamate deiminase [uncultured Maricaulis sp.]|uniref:formimidoylglutamate deiminase n=1 Tax=uncultured Maricaulis sp. TaxID=174710 RepID=UPI0030DB8FB9|tara:strand:- start:188997 stop:190367 length:1371 start_codon:yes stop_codon:yes gene_type:complete